MRVGRTSFNLFRIFTNPHRVKYIHTSSGLFGYLVPLASCTLIIYFWKPSTDLHNSDWVLTTLLDASTCKLLNRGEVEEFGGSPSSLFCAFCLKYQHHCQQTAPEHDATTRLNRSCSVFTSESLTFTPPNNILSLWPYFSYCLVWP